MLLSEIKLKLGVNDLPLTRGKDEKGQPTKWLTFWNNLPRFMVVIHEDMIKALNTKKDLQLRLVSSEKNSKTSGKPYINHMIVEQKDVEVTL